MKLLLTPIAMLLFVFASCSGSDGDATCGPQEAGLGITGTFADSTVTWNQFKSSENNDCTQPDAPVSLLLEGQQQGSDRLFTLCLPRPDKLSGNPIELSDSDRIQIIAIFADDDDCLVSHDRTRSVSGTIDFIGVCDNAKHPDGYSIEVNATIPITITCDQDVTMDSMVLSGSAAAEEITPSNML